MTSKNKKTTNNDTWLTPMSFYMYLDDRFQFDKFDPCPQYCDLELFNGLDAEWASKTFCNPPYSRWDKELFIYKALLESKKGKLVVMLLPVSTSSNIFHEVILPYAKVEFIHGRLLFEGIDSDGCWCNPHVGMTALKNTTDTMPKVKRSGQNDSMLVIFDGR